jgi:hypothetical protein
MGANLKDAIFKIHYLNDYDEMKAVNSGLNSFHFFAAILPNGQRLRGSNLVVAGGAESKSTSECYSFSKELNQTDDSMNDKQFWNRIDDKIITMPCEKKQSCKGCYFTAKPSSKFSWINQTIDMLDYKNIIQYGLAYFKISFNMKAPYKTKSYIAVQCISQNHSQLQNHSFGKSFLLSKTHLISKFVYYEGNTGGAFMDIIRVHQSTRYACIMIRLVSEPTNSTSLTDITMIDDIEFNLHSLYDL